MLDKDTRISILKKLHDILWNSEGFDPQTAKDHLLMFFTIRLLEEHLEEFGLSEECCKYSYLNELVEQDVSDLKLNSELREAIIIFKKHDATKEFFPPYKIKNGRTIREILLRMKELKKKDLKRNDILGEVYELVGGDKGDSKIGQYFTNRKICELAFRICYSIKQTVYRDDGTICTFCDPFCGTGGFAGEFVKGVNAYTDEKPDWTVHRDNVYCFDRNANTIPVTLLNLLLATGTSFSNIENPKIRSLDSFRDKIVIGDDSVFPGLEIDFGMTNPPFGGDKKEGKFCYLKKTGKGKNQKIEYCVNDEIQEIGIADDDKVSAAVQLCMTMLADGGVQAMVLPQGFFFGAGKKKIELRQKLAEEYRIHFVVDIPQDAFIGTGTKTSMIVFQKGVGSTEDVQFLNLEEELLATANLEQLQEKEYSLNWQHFARRTGTLKEGFELVSLNEILTISTGKNKTPDDKKGSLYPYYGTSGITGYTDHFLVDGDYILTARNGTIGNTFFISGKTYPSDHMFILKTNEKCILRYLYFWILWNKKQFEVLANTTTIPGITKKDLLNVKIPLPSLEEQEKAVQAIERWEKLIQMEEESLKILEEAVKYDVEIMGRGKEKVALIEICEIKAGKSLTKANLIAGSFPVIGGGVSPMGFHDESNREPFNIIISQVGANCGNVSRYQRQTWVTNNGFTVQPKVDKIFEDFLFYSLKIIEDEIKRFGQGTAQPKLSAKDFLQIEIPLPPIENQRKLESHFKEIRHKHEKIAEYRLRADEAIVEYIPKIE